MCESAQRGGAAVRLIRVEANPAYDIGSPGEPPGGRRSRLLPVVAIAAVAAVVIVVVLLAVLPAGTTAGTTAGHPPGRARPPAAMPRYYVTISQYVFHPEAVVRESASGAVTGQAAVPSAERPAVSMVTAAADDRSFIIGAYETGPAGSIVCRFFRLRITVAGRPGPLTELPEVVPSRAGVQGIARLSRPTAAVSSRPPAASSRGPVTAAVPSPGSSWSCRCRTGG